MTMQLRKATRQKAKIRLGLSAASGGGKTFSGLKIAKGLAGGDLSKVAIIDTENGSADLYAHMGEYLVLALEAPYSPERYIEAIRACEQAGVEVIIIDSITHEWDGDGGILRIADSLTGDSFTKWKTLTPRHQAFVDAILKSKCHILTTVRRKQEYAMVKDEMTGKNRVEKLGLREITREGFDYELTVNLELDQNHNAWVGKDRTELFAGKPTFVPTEETGRLLAEWCENGEDINVQVTEAIAKLANCANRDEIVMLKETLPILVVNHSDFKTAGNARWMALAPVQEPATDNFGTSEASAAVSSAESGTSTAVETTPANTDENSGNSNPAENSADANTGTSTASGTATDSTDQETLKLQIQSASTPEELTRLHQIVKTLEPGPKKSLSISVTTRAKNAGWVANKEKECWETPAPAEPAKPADEPVNDPKKAHSGDEPYGFREPESLIKKEPTEAEKPLFDQLHTAPDAETLHKIYAEHADQVNASNPLTYVFKERLEELTHATITEAFEKATSRDELKEIYQQHMRDIQASKELSECYEQARNRYPVLLDSEPHKRDLKWFQDRIGKTVQMHGADETKYTGPYVIENETFPEHMVAWQASDGFTFSDIPNSYVGLEGTKLD